MNNFFEYIGFDLRGAFPGFFGALLMVQQQIGRIKWLKVLVTLFTGFGIAGFLGVAMAKIFHLQEPYGFSVMGFVVGSSGVRTLKFFLNKFIPEEDKKNVSNDK